MHRIYFDANEGDERGRFDLGIPGALRDIEIISSELAEGMHVILYDNEELEIEAVLEFDQKYQRWMASPLWNTLKRSHE
jgi:hypothetical protein